MTTPSFRAPAEDFGVLSRPALADWPSLAQKNYQLLNQKDLAIGTKPLAELRLQARADFLRTSAQWLGKPEAEIDLQNSVEKIWIMTGHQPELYHPGVWAKNFAVAAVAQKMGASGLNLVADTDQLKSCEIKVPSGAPENLVVRKLAFDDVADGRPYEAWNVHNSNLFQGFGNQLLDSLSSHITNPLAAQLWPQVASVNDTSGSRKISLARHLIEENLGFGLIESPMSLWAETPAVQHIFCTILADIPAFHALHSAHLKAYRKLHGIKSRNHPVADLEEVDGWWESPLWVWRDSSPVRKSLWVRICPAGSGVELRIEGESDSLCCLAIKPGYSTSEGCQQLERLSGEGVRIRPRALVTTALCRTLLADLFVHGIGGAIYDELGDDIFGDFFRLRMPQYAVMSATLRLCDLPPPAASKNLEEAHRTLRRILWKAETLTEHSAEVAALLNHKKELLLTHPQDRLARRRRAVALRQVNRQIAACYKDRENQVLQEINRLRQEAVHEASVRSREYSIVVHSYDRLGKLAKIIRQMT